MATPKVTVGAVVPPKITRGKRGSQIPKEIIDAFIAGLATVGEDESPSWISDQVPYESRPKANAAASKIRKAVIEAVESQDEPRYTDIKNIQSRVWSVGEVTADGDETGPFYFALAERPAEQ